MPQNEDKYLSLFEHMTSGVAVYKAIDGGKNFIFTDFNPAAERIENMSKSQVLGKRLDEVFPGVHEFGLFEVLRRVWKTGKPEYLPKSPYIDSRIQKSWRENWVYKLSTDEVVAVYNDITTRVRAEKEVESQKNLFKNVIDNIPNAIFWKDINSVYFGCNQNFANIAGVGIAANIFGKTDHDLPWTKDEADAFVEADKKVMESGVPALNLEGTQHQTDGRIATIMTSRVPLRDSGGSVIGLLGIFNDITIQKNTELAAQKAYDELKIMQADLIQSEKMAAIGRFSAGIAHEVKNPLAIIVGCAELLENTMPRHDQNSMNTLEKIKDAAFRANSILMSLLQYARPSALKAEIAGPQELVCGVLPLFEKRLHEIGVTVVTQFSDEKIQLSVDKNHMHQVIFNIIKNAIEAMPDGGVITIRTYRMVVPELSYLNPSCVIELKDTGSGISGENITKISEPFFSTKDRVAGTGLGLFMVKSILDKHKGKLLIESAAGHGATIKVILPIAQA